MSEARFSDLMNVTLASVAGLNKNSEKAVFTAVDGRTWTMEHSRDCCESVSIEDVVGDIADLVGSPIVRAEEPSSLDGFSERAGSADEECGSHTWTFYILGTSKGTVTIRWYGSSNGYYSETPSFYAGAERW